MEEKGPRSECSFVILQTTTNIKNLKDKVLRMEQAYLSDRDKLYNLFDKGIIDESGVSIIHRDESDMKI